MEIIFEEGFLETVEEKYGSLLTTSANTTPAIPKESNNQNGTTTAISEKVVSELNVEVDASEFPELKIKALLIGLESMIIGLEQLNHQCWQEALSKFGYETITFEDYQDWFTYRHPLYALRYLLPFCTMEQCSSALREKEEFFVNKIKQKNVSLKLMDGLKEFICSIPYPYSHKMLKVVVSDLSMKEMKECVTFLNLDGEFDCIFSGIGVGSAKPHPAVYSRVLSELKLKKEEIFVIEASTQGVISAKYSGIKNIIGIRTQCTTINNFKRKVGEVAEEDNSFQVTTDNTMHIVDEGAKVVVDDFNSLMFIYLVHMV